MRVTKTVREYIEKQVRLKIAPKYEAEMAEEKRQCEVVEKLYETIFDAAEQIISDMLDEAVQQHDFLVDKRKDGYVLRLSTYGARCIDVATSKNENAQARMCREIKEVVDNIIVNLELGGNKDDLDRMLAEL